MTAGHITATHNPAASALGSVPMMAAVVLQGLIVVPLVSRPGPPQSSRLCRQI
jgi:hypothetical protein